MLNDDTNMSDAGLLVTVEDLINRAMGPPNDNKINFKLVQIILEILARQQRMLHQKIEIRIIELQGTKKKTTRGVMSESSSKSLRSVESTIYTDTQKHEKFLEDKTVVDKDLQENQRERQKEKKDEGQNDYEEKSVEYKEDNPKEKKERKGAETLSFDKISVADLVERTKKIDDTGNFSEEISVANKVVTVERTKEKQDIQIKASDEKSVSFIADIEKKPKETKEVGIKTSEKISVADKSDLAENTKEIKKEKLDTLINISEVESQAQKTDIKQKPIESKVSEKKNSDKKSVADKISVEQLKDGVKKISEEKSAQNKDEKPKKINTENKNAEIKVSEAKSVAEKVSAKEKKESEKIDINAADNAYTEKKSKEKQKSEKIASKDINTADNAYTEKKSKEKKEQEKNERKEHKKDEIISEKKPDDSNISRQVTAQKKKELEREEMKVQEKRLKESQEKGRRSAKEEMQTTGSSAIEITEKEIDKEKVLVVARGPTTLSDSRSPSGIDFVSRSEFELLKATVKELSKFPFPKLLVLPENEELINDLKMGTATLSKTMQTLQVNERLKSAEASMTTVVNMLTTLASAGALPEEIAEQVETILPTMHDEAEKLGALRGIKTFGAPSMAGADSQLSATPSEGPSTVNKLSVTSVVTKVSCVTFMDMKVALLDLKNDVLKLYNKTIDKMSASAELSENITKTLAEKLNVVQDLDSRISVLYSRVEEYAKYLNEVGSEIETQFRQTEKQIAETYQNITNGLLQLKNVNNNSEIEAVMAITEHYEDIEKKLDVINNEHKSLTMEQLQFISRMNGLMDCMDMMRQEKANRSKVLDDVSYKADTSQLLGLLTQSDFTAARNDFERRLDQCHKRFKRSIVTWAAVVKDLRHIKEKKVDLIDLLSERESTQAQLRDLNNKIKILTDMLGDPKSAIITRQLSAGANCGACHESVLIELSDPTSKVPLKLPALRKTPVETPKASIPVWISGQSVQRHICRRWCGGSHTTADPKNRIQLHLQLQEVPTTKYTAYGEDGRLYKFEEELQPCFDCNALSGKMTQEPVRGDVEGRITTPET